MAKWVVKGSFVIFTIDLYIETADIIHYLAAVHGPIVKIELAQSSSYHKDG